MKKTLNNKTMVFLIGAGPGDPGLLTKKAEKTLNQADVVIYDSLVSRGVLKLIKNAELIPAGRRKQKHTVSQRRVNELILENVHKGNVVARLKGGDPLIFGRAAEEMDLLDWHGIKYEIIPGISAAQAAASCMEIPLTERGKASSVIFCTGHPIGSATLPPKSFKGTVVYYMAAATMGEIARKLLKKGWDKKTHAAAVSCAGTSRQKAVRLSLGKIAKMAKPFPAPAVVIIGGVTAL